MAREIGGDNISGTIHVANTLSVSSTSSVVLGSSAGSVVTANEIDNAGTIDASTFPGGLIVNGGGAGPSGTSGYYQFANSLLQEDIQGLAAGPGSTCTGNGDCGIILAGGAAYLSGLLDPVLENGFMPSLGDQFLFMTFNGDYTGPGFTLENYSIGNGLDWNVVYGDGFAKLVVSNVPEPATFLLMGAGFLVLGILARRRSGSIVRKGTGYSVPSVFCALHGLSPVCPL